MRVPISTDNLVARQPLTDEKFVAANPGPSGLGAGLQTIGQAGSQAAEVQDAINREMDEATTRERDNHLVDQAQSLLYDGPGAYFNLQGKDALAARGDVQGKLKTLGDDLIGSATDPRQKRMITDMVNQRMNGWQREIGRHAAEQTFEYNKKEISGRIELGTSAAVSSWDDLPTSDKNVATVRTEAGNLADTLGIGPDARDALVQSKVSAARTGVATSIIAAGPKGPAAGQAYLDKYRADFSGDDQKLVDHYIRSQTDYFQAQAHKAEVEAKQQARAQVADDRQLAEDYISGAAVSPRPPLETANAQAAAARVAAATGNTGLQVRVATIATQNGVKVAYQNATPSELQAAANEIAPRTRGDNPDPDAVVRYETLTQMQQQTKAELERDPLSWGAKHMGLQVGQIDWNNPASVQSRVQAAQRISARTGVQPKFLTDEEASVLAPQASSPDIKQQQAVIAKLAQFGPEVAGSAAQQIAPRDPRFLGLIGLATIKHRSVANALVSRALQGSEVLKTFPKIINDRGGADGSAFGDQFQTVVGDAFKFMPNAAAGVLALSRSLLAANAVANGVHESANNRMPGSTSGLFGREHKPNDFGSDNHPVIVAINDALGAYNGPDGRQRGGIGSHNGHITVLPSDMSQDEFDTTIARSDGPTLRKAANGDPVWANGKPITSTQLKTMEMLPVGDGKYVFGSGSAIIRTPQGQPFVLDVTKVRRPAP